VNPRLRGKIPHSEWSRIAEQFAGGETLTEIARRYGCTAPAIRYIVKRQPSQAGRRGRAEHNPKLSGDRLFAKMARSANLAEEARSIKTLGGGGSLPESFWARVSGDVAGFLAAMDAIIAEENEKTEAALLGAADRLLRASALTRIEIERIRSFRKRPLRVV
jgi:transposase-like protein